jgi:hypothetical protein
MRPFWKPLYVKALTFLMAVKMVPVAPAKARYLKVK